MRGGGCSFVSPSSQSAPGQLEPECRPSTGSNQADVATVRPHDLPGQMRTEPAPIAVTALAPERLEDALAGRLGNARQHFRRMATQYDKRGSRCLWLRSYKPTA